ncbi:MAG: DUF6115 domain-containing protein [Desulfatiglandales bacterium]
MKTQIWIFSQIAIDVILVLVLFWFMRLQRRRQLDWQEQEAVIQKSEVILSEMRDISRSLEKNLEDKKELSRRILDQLEQGLKRAEESYHQISEIIPNSGGRMPQQREHTRSSVLALLEKGLSKEEIARHLNISVGEIELLIKLDTARNNR